MLTELNVTDYAVIDRLSLRLGAGFTVLTGETGAGKSIILGALGLLLGDRVDASAVRSRAERAYIEGVFELHESDRRAVEKVLDDEIADGVLIVGREVSAGGRSACRVNGRTVPLKVLQAVGVRLVDVHGQSTHLSLLRPAEQRRLLDRFGHITELTERFAGWSRRIRSLRKELAEADRKGRENAQRQELMRFQVAEIEAAGLRPGEEEELTAERSVMVNAQAIAQHVAECCAALDGEDSPQPGAAQMVSSAVRALRSVEALDPATVEARQRAESTGVQIAELVRDLRDYAESATYDPQRLAEVEERLEIISSLKRKYGPTVEEVLAFGDRVSAELVDAEQSRRSHTELQAELDELIEQAAQAAVELDAQRSRAALRLCDAVEEQLRFLGLEGAAMGVTIRHAGEVSGLPPADVPFVDYDVRARSIEEVGRLQEPVKFGSAGAAEVEFVISTNPGEPLKPMSSVASGGETSRLMLAIKSALAEVDDIPTLVFDEVDAGIGGQTGEAVGLKLARLGRRHQVLAVTHLPQIAAHGRSHYSARKVTQGERTTTVAIRVEGEDRLEEITRMLGTPTAATRQKAAELLAEAGNLSG